MQGTSGTVISNKHTFLPSKYFKFQIYHFIPIRRNIIFASNKLSKTQKQRVRSNVFAVYCMHKQLILLL